jgi:4-amino-4-deoxy-L-arabinose transferase-like glycosyltransferase
MNKINWRLYIIIAAAAVLRLSLAGAHRFHGDEAMYSHWAVKMARYAFLYPGSAFTFDKPPFYMAAAALSWLIFPVKEIFAEIPNIIAGIIAVFFVYRIARLNSDEYTALLAAVIFSLIPFNVEFSATAFTDPLMVCFLSAATLFFLEKEYFKFGVFFALALGTKQFALFFLLFYALTYILENRRPEAGKIKTALKGALKGFVPVYSAAVVWGAAVGVILHKGIFASGRSFGLNVLPVMFDTGIIDAVTRLGMWDFYFGSVFVCPVITAAVLVAVVLLLNARRDICDIAMVLTILVLLFGISALRSPVYDRYILVFVPFISILAARGISAAVIFDSPVKARLSIGVAAAVMCLFPLHQMYFGGIRNLEGQGSGAFYDRNAGIDAIAARVYHGAQGRSGIYYEKDVSWVFYYYLEGAKNGYFWAPINEDDNDALIREVKGSMEKENRQTYLLFYSDNDRSMIYEPGLRRIGYGLFRDLTSFDREGRANLVLYKVVKHAL